MRVSGYRRYSALLSNLIMASLVISGFTPVAAQPIIRLLPRATRPAATVFGFYTRVVC